MRARLTTRCGCSQDVEVPSPPPPVWVVELQSTIREQIVQGPDELLPSRRTRAFDLSSYGVDWAYYIEQWPPFEGTHQGDLT